MNCRKSIILALIMSSMPNCVPEQSVSPSPAADDDPFSMSTMRADFFDRCRARPEYQSRKRAGTLDKLCDCFFKTTMRGLSDDERKIAAFYLYGETNEKFLENYRNSPPDLDAMPAAVEAVGKAAKRCR